MFQHVTVLGPEAVEALQVKPGGIYVDCTLGGGGHSFLIAQRLNQDGWLIGIDQDEEALERARQRLSSLKAKLTLVHNNFRNLAAILDSLQVEKVDGLLYDLGVSSPQLDQQERGFSYQKDAPLDMRMDQTRPLTAYDVVNTYGEEELADIIRRYGEERFYRRIARRIVERRRERPIQTTKELADLIKQSIPAKARETGPHPAKRTFQAIRIAVNDELGALSQSLAQAVPLLKPGGRLVVITFHSLEDRICKQFFKEQSAPCTCPPGLPQCVCGKKPTLKIVTKKPILPSPEEIEQNPRSRSAKMRVAEKI